MYANHVLISHLGTDVSSHLTYDACITTHLAINGEFTTSYVCAISQCRMSKVIFLIRDICNHQGTHLLKSAVDNDTPFSLIHDINWTRKHHTSIAACKT